MEEISSLHVIHKFSQLQSHMANGNSFCTLHFMQTAGFVLYEQKEYWDIWRLRREEQVPTLKVPECHFVNINFLCPGLYLGLVGSSSKKKANHSLYIDIQYIDTL